MPKRILYVEANTDGTIGGSHYSLLALVQHLDRSRYEPLVLFYEDSPVVPLFKAACPVMVVNLRRYLRLPQAWVRRPLNGLKYLRHIVRCLAIIVTKRVDLVHLSNSVLCGYDTWLVASILAGVPCLTHERGFSVFDLAAQPFTRRLLGKYKAVICVSEAMRKNLIDRGLDPAKVVTIHNGIDAAAYRRRVQRTSEQVRSEFAVPPGAILLGLVGNIRRWKGQALLVEALRLVSREDPRFFCLFVGEVAADSKDDAEYATELREMIARYQISDRCVLTGYRGDIPDLMNACDVLVNASVEPDPFPRVILEAMAVGRPVIATDLGGAVESIAEGKTGFLVPAHDPAPLADRILRFMRDPSLRDRMSKDAAARAAVFDICRTASLTQQVYEGLFEGRTTTARM